MSLNEPSQPLPRHPALPLPVIFIDDGGVLNDNGRRGPEYLRLLGKYLPSCLGGTADQWKAANQAVFAPLWADMQSRIGTFANFADYQREYELRWIGEMCAHVGLPTPPPDAAIALARSAAVHVETHADAAIDRAADAVRMLRAAGYLLHTASGTPSWELEAILTRMGVRPLFATLYGPDLIDHVKHGPEYYRRIFRHAAVLPEQALVVQSSPTACGWARSTGARAVWITPDAHEGPAGDRASALADLAAALVNAPR